MGPGALFFWLQWENTTLFHVWVNAAVEALPAVIAVRRNADDVGDNKMTLTFLWLGGMFS
jgi:hypothetical protein